MLRTRHANANAHRKSFHRRRKTKTSSINVIEIELEKASSLSDYSCQSSYSVWSTINMRLIMAFFLWCFLFKVSQIQFKCKFVRITVSILSQVNDALAAPWQPNPKCNLLAGISNGIGAMASGIGAVSNGIGGISRGFGRFINGLTGQQRPLIIQPQLPQQNGGFIVGPNGQLFPVASSSPGTVALPPGTALTPIGVATLFPAAANIFNRGWRI